ncbi:protein SSUH2 homolog isoform X1 [Ictalurus punctatus]|uniref:Protein SSUH2 homolog isoform X1 n=2 Tax=Ictalurus punctatus TaxID=7998 RepID=A0A2D0QVL5_ICTPU|nr:protein SSUH2 homolog isoform X1 [Ictalurus punctatus]
MERRPVFNDYGATHGTDNPGYMPSASSTPAMSGGPAAPSAPPAGFYDTVPGYEGTLAGGGGGFLPPPIPSAPLPAQDNLPAQPNWNISSITEEVAREAFVSFSSSKCCYSSAPARDGVITNLEPFNTYRYRLETFTETRSTEWSQEPYTGQPVDAFIQPAPAPWAITAQTPNFFQDQTQNIRVPYTSSVKNCHVCMGMGRKPCKDCAGSGNKVCWVCNGSGFRHGTDRCTHCNGRGRENCTWCHGHGSRECETCRGKRQLLVFITLKIQWTTTKNDYVVEQLSGLKSENLNQVTGRAMFTDSQHMLYPVMGFPDPSLNQASERLIREHQSKYFQTSRILQQRHTIELIPITRVHYAWKGKSYLFFVFGNENTVYTDDYPAKCCCSVM